MGNSDESDYMGDQSDSEEHEDTQEECESDESENDSVVEVGFQAGVDKPIVAPAATAASEVRTYLMLLILL